MTFKIFYSVEGLYYTVLSAANLGFINGKVECRGFVASIRSI